jgi:hypothetical protein
MDNFRPTIVVTEMVANRRDCASAYQMICSLVANNDEDQIDKNYYPFIYGNIGEFPEEHRDNNDRSVGVIIKLRFGQWQGKNFIDGRSIPQQ